MIWRDWLDYPAADYGEYFVLLDNGYRTVLVYDDKFNEWRRQFEEEKWNGMKFKWLDETKSE